MEQKKNQITTSIRNLLIFILAGAVCLLTIISIYDYTQFSKLNDKIIQENIKQQMKFTQELINALSISFKEKKKKLSYDTLLKSIDDIVSKTSHINSIYDSKIYVFNYEGEILLHPDSILNKKYHPNAREEFVISIIKNNEIFDDKVIKFNRISALNKEEMGNHSLSDFKDDYFYIKKVSAYNIYLGQFLHNNKNSKIETLTNDFFKKIFFRFSVGIVLAALLILISFFLIRNFFTILKLDIHNFFNFIKKLSEKNNDNLLISYNFDEFYKISSYAEDMTEKLSESENRYKNLFQINTVALWEKDYTHLMKKINEFKAGLYPDFEKLKLENPDFFKNLNGYFIDIDVNFATLRMFESFSKNELFSSADKICIPEEQLRINEELVKALYNGESSVKLEVNYLTTSGKNLSVLMHLSILSNSNPPSIIISMVDITNRKLMEQEITDEKELLSVTLKSIGEGVIAVDNSFHITLMNSKAEEITGWNFHNALDKRLGSVFVLVEEKNGREINNYLKYITNPGEFGSFSENVRLLDLEGNNKYVTHSFSAIINQEGFSLGGVITFRDVTEKKRLEEENLNIKKLESIGNLAGGMAHEFNNYLQTILGNISLAEVYGKDNEKVVKKIQAAKKSCKNAKKLSHKLLSFSMDSTPRKKIINFADYINDSFFSTLLGGRKDDIIISTDYQEDNWEINIDPDQLKIIISHLITNSIKAMPSGGRIIITTENDFLSYTGENGVEIGRYLKFMVKDTGIGIIKEDLKKIFDPYFTTSEMGDGLGLATVYYIIQNHGGYINVQSEKGIGTEFIIHLPAVKKSLTESYDSEVTARKKYKGTVVVMDDEAHIRKISSEVLKYSGYRCFTAENGDEVLDIYKSCLKEEIKIDLFVLDLIVNNGLGGYETIKKLLNYDPNVSAIICSGFSTEKVVKEYLDYGFNPT